jgi:hypothetical protein
MQRLKPGHDLEDVLIAGSRLALDSPQAAVDEADHLPGFEASL